MSNIKHDIDIKDKGKSWISDVIKHYWDQFRSTYPSDWHNGRSSYHIVRQYGRGAQSTGKYKKVLVPQKEANEDTTWLRINWDILPIIPKFRRIAIASLKKLGYSFELQAVDSLAKDEQEKYYAEAAMKIFLRNELEKQGVDPTVLGLKRKDATDFDELEMNMKYSWKSQAAIEVESALELILNNNRREELRERFYEDIFDFGVAGCREYVDYDGEIKYDYVSPMDAVVGPSESPYFDDLEFAGQVKEMSVSQIKNMTNSEDNIDWDDLGDQLRRKRNITEIDKLKHSVSDVDSIKASVLHMEFKSVNKKKYSSRITKNGVMAYGPDKEGEEVNYDVVYEGYWVIDTDVYFGCELATNMKRDPRALKKTNLSYHFVAPSLYQMSTYSLGKEMIAIADQIQIAWYKLQNAIARAKPRGIAIEATSLQDVPFGVEELTPQAIVNMYNYTGNMVYRRVNEEGDVANWRPIDELDNGLGDEAVRYWQVIQQSIQLLRDITGFNEITDGSTPDSKTLKSVAEMAANSTNNAIHYIYDSEKNFFKRTAEDIMLRVQDAAQDGTIEGYRNALGQTSVEFFKLSKDVSWREIGLFIKDDPTEEDKRALVRRVEIALQNQEITLEDANFVEHVSNPKQALEVLAYRIKKKREADQAQALQLQQANAETQQQSSRVAEEEKRRTAQLEHQFKLREIDREGQWRIKVTGLENQRFTNQELIKGEARITEKKIDTESEEYLAGKS